MDNHVFVGIDVCKARLDTALRPGDESFDVTNNQRGIAALVKLRVNRIVLEASAGYGTLLAPRVDWLKPTRSTLEYWPIFSTAAGCTNPRTDGTGRTAPTGGRNVDCRE